MAQDRGVRVLASQGHLEDEEGITPSFLFHPQSWSARRAARAGRFTYSSQRDFDNYGVLEILEGREHSKIASSQRTGSRLTPPSPLELHLVRACRPSTPPKRSVSPLPWNPRTTRRLSRPTGPRTRKGAASLPTVASGEVSPSPWTHLDDQGAVRAP